MTRPFLTSLFSFLSLTVTYTLAQSQTPDATLHDTLSHVQAPRRLLRKTAVPLTLITVGSALSGSAFEKNIKHGVRDNIIDDFSLPIDDLMQYAPIAEIYIADLMGVKAKNHWFDQTKYLAIANVITTIFTQAGKRIINKKRPSGGSYSFPSGHTSFSFTNSAVLFEEFHDSAPVFAYGNYFLTSTVGALRVVNNAHWLSDVIVGAGLGILVTKIVYYFEPLKNWNPFLKSENISFIPTINGKEKGFCFTYTF